MGCGAKLASTVLLIFNALFVLLGLALLGGGIWMLVSQEKLFNVLNLINEKTGSNEGVGGELERISQQKGVVATAGAILVAVGTVSSVISLFGCFGAIKQSKCLLGIYAGIIGVLLGAQIAAAVLALLYKNKAIELATDQLLGLQNKYLISVNDFPVAKRQPHSAVSLLFNYMFVSFKCCGVNSTVDAALSTSWLASNRTWLGRGFMTVPATCCPVKDHARILLLTESRWDFLPELLQKPNCPITAEDVNRIGCVAALLKFIDSYSMWVLIGCISFAAAQLFVFLFTECLICAISDNDKYS